MGAVRRRASGTLLAATVLACAGCTPPAAPGGRTPSDASVGPGPSTATATPVARSATAGPRVGLPTAPAPTRTAARSCTDRVLDARTVHLTGSRGSVDWDLAVPQFSGASSAAAVNRRVRASAQDMIDRTLREGRDDDGVRRTLGGTAAVTTSDRRTVQVELRADDFLAGTAHPASYVATTVVTTAEGRPLRLRDVLADVPGGLRTIAKAVEPMLEPTDPSGLAPKESNFAAWQTTAKGMRFTFADGQLGGPGLRTSTVPWTTVRPLLSDYGTGLLDPDVEPSTC